MEQNQKLNTNTPRSGFASGLPEALQVGHRRVAVASDGAHLAFTMGHGHSGAPGARLLPEGSQTTSTPQRQQEACDDSEADDEGEVLIRHAPFQGRSSKAVSWQRCSTAEAAAVPCWQLNMPLHQQTCTRKVAGSAGNASPLMNQAGRMAGFPVSRTAAL